ncbi:MAG: hypothetical protein F7C35_02675 [Desulfurococcales archaeon]|nr:hypothetical protein [Desulfurococcales archaeon]
MVEGVYASYSMANTANKVRRWEVFLALLDEILLVTIILIIILYILYDKGIIGGTPYYTSLLTIMIFDLILIKIVLSSQIKPSTVGREALIGRAGRVIKDLDPEGLVEVNGEIWKAVSRSGIKIRSGRQVVVVDVKGLTLIVEEKEDGRQV